MRDEELTAEPDSLRIGKEEQFALIDIIDSGYLDHVNTNRFIDCETIGDIWRVHVGADGDSVSGDDFEYVVDYFADLVTESDYGYRIDAEYDCVHVDSDTDDEKNEGIKNAAINLCDRDCGGYNAREALRYLQDTIAAAQ